MREQSTKNFEQKRTRLTKLWLALLLFNVALHLDFVEDFFDPSDTESVRFVAAELECSSMAELSSPEAPNQSILTSLFSNGIAVQNSFSIVKVGSNINLPRSLGYKISNLSDQFVKSDQTYSDRCSGLSPPFIV